MTWVPAPRYFVSYPFVGPRYDARPERNGRENPFLRRRKAEDVRHSGRTQSQVALHVLRPWYYLLNAVLGLVIFPDTHNNGNAPSIPNKPILSPHV